MKVKKSAYRMAKIQEEAVHKAEQLSGNCHFIHEEIHSLCDIYLQLTTKGPMDRMRFRFVLQSTFDITDDLILDLSFHAFDRDDDGEVSVAEWIEGLSIMFRGSPKEIIEFCWLVYDINKDNSLARDELSHCLKGCIIPGFGIDTEEYDECEKDVVEMALKQLDRDKDGMVNKDDFSDACIRDPLLVQSLGFCIPTTDRVSAFMCLFSEDARAYQAAYGGAWDKTKIITPVRISNHQNQLNVLKLNNVAFNSASSHHSRLNYVRKSKGASKAQKSQVYGDRPANISFYKSVGRGDKGVAHHNEKSRHHSHHHFGHSASKNLIPTGLKAYLGPTASNAFLVPSISKNRIAPSFTRRKLH